MTSNSPSPLEQVLPLVQRLPLTDKFRLLEHLVADLAATVPPPDDDPWEEFLRIGDELAHEPPLPQESAEVLSAMRR